LTTLLGADDAMTEVTDEATAEDLAELTLALMIGIDELTAADEADALAEEEALAETLIEVFPVPVPEARLE